MNRIEQLREHIDDMLLHKKDTQDRRCAYIHGAGEYSELGEILLDANLLQHAYYNPLLPVKYGEDKLVQLLADFGIKNNV